MLAPFDLFRVVAGNPIWIETAQTLDAAKTRIDELMRADSCEYLILSQKTGKQLSIKPSA